jgi:hypothetical protein
MMISTKYIGMDVHKESISIAVRNSAGKVVMESVIETKASMILQSRLFSERNALGVQTSVYNVNTKSWIAPSEPVEDIEQARKRPRPMQRRT